MSDEANTPPDRFPLTVALLAVLLALPVADLAFRVRYTARDVARRPWEIVIEHAVWPSVFGANEHATVERAVGDLAIAANLVGRYPTHREVFTTDALGWRNAPELLDGKPVDVVFTGSSFTVGAGVSDDETVSALVARGVGKRIYNAGGNASPPKAYLEKFRQALKFESGLILREIVVRPDQFKFLKTTLNPTPTDASGALTRWLDFSPLRIFVQRALRGIEDDRVLPNLQRNRATELTLSNGVTALFHPEDAAIGNPASWLSDVPEVDRTAEELRQLGHPVVHVLLPGKYLTYRTMLSAPPNDGGAPVEALALLTARLQKAGGLVIDTTPAVIAEARRLLPKNEYVFLLDDTHMSPAGSRAVAAEIVRRWPEIVSRRPGP